MDLLDDLHKIKMKSVVVLIDLFKELMRFDETLFSKTYHLFCYRAILLCIDRS